MLKKLKLSLTRLSNNWEDLTIRLLQPYPLFALNFKPSARTPPPIKIYFSE
jgi:hypothetical protein